MLYRQKLLTLAATPLLLLAPLAAQAQTAENPDTDAIAEQLNSAIANQQTEAGALSNAQQHVRDGDMLSAARVLEGFLINDPESVAARVEYATLLCQLDDHQAADFELAKLAATKIGESQKSQLKAVCGISTDEVVL